MESQVVLVLRILPLVASLVLAQPAEEALRAQYEQAFAHVLADEYEEAIPLLEGVIELSQDAKLSGAAESLLRLAQAKAAAAPVDTEKEASGRLQFVATSTLGGVAVGTELAILFQTTDPRVVALFVMAGTGSGFFGSYLGTQNRSITRGEASLYGTAAYWGTSNGVLIAGLTTVEGQGAGALALAGTVGGGVLGYYVAHKTGLSAGRATLVASSSRWSSIVGLLLLVVVDPNDQRQFSALLATSLNVGVAAGALAASQLDFSRNRVLLGELGALLGGIGLGGVGILTSADEQTTAGLAIAGIVSGGALSFYLTRNMDRRTSGLEIFPGGIPVVTRDRVWVPLLSGRF